MKILKFGGSSVSNVDSIDCVIEIIKNTNSKLTIVISALGGVTDILSEMAAKAGKGDLNYKNKINIVKKRHIEIIENILVIRIYNPY